MQLNLRTDYALRMLMTLAREKGVVSIDWIASKHAISRNHLAKVAQELAALGVIETQRGRGGGVKLARSPEAINVGAIVRSLENLEGFVDCMGGKGECVLAGACGLAPVLAGALEAFLEYLDRYTLADITAGKLAMPQAPGPSGDRASGADARPRSA